MTTKEAGLPFGFQAMTPTRLLRIGFRLSLVAGLVTGLYGAWIEAVRVSESKASAERIWTGLLCASKVDPASLQRVLRPDGVYDISKLGCGRGSGPDGAFFASAMEIDEARRNDRSKVFYNYPFSPDVPMNHAIGVFIIVNLIAALMALAWVVGRWVFK